MDSLSSVTWSGDKVCWRTETNSSNPLILDQCLTLPTLIVLQFHGIFRKATLRNSIWLVTFEDMFILHQVYLQIQPSVLLATVLIVEGNFAWLSGVLFFEGYLLLWIVSVERPCWLVCVQVKGGRQGQTTCAVVEEMGFSWKQWKLVVSFNLSLEDVDFCNNSVSQRFREKHCPVFLRPSSLLLTWGFIP